MTKTLFQSLRRRTAIRLLGCLIGQQVKAYLSIPPGTYIEHALVGEAFAARMYSEQPDAHPQAQDAYRWAEQQFNRIARGEVGERDLIG